MEQAISDTPAAVETYIPALRRFARALLRGDPARADDLVQDSLERAVAHWYRRRPERQLRGWLFTILYNRFITEMRRRKREFGNRSLDDIPEGELPGSAGGQERALACRDLLRGFAELPPDQRAVLLLVGTEDFTYEEAARILGVPIGTVMSRVSRGRERLRRYMEEGRPAARSFARWQSVGAAPAHLARGQSQIEAHPPAAFANLSHAGG